MSDGKENPKYISRVTTDNVRCLINKTGKAIFREMIGDDIGSDGIVELIKLTRYTQIPTGKIVLPKYKARLRIGNENLHICNVNYNSEKKSVIEKIFEKLVSI